MPVSMLDEDRNTARMITNLQALNKAYTMLEEKLAQGEFLYKTWMDLADLFPKNSRRSWEIRRKAAIIQRERSASKG